MKLIITEKPSTAEIIAHVVGAREKVYGEGKEFCYFGGGYYVVNAKGHLYGIGLPQDYNFSKSFKIDELPIIPDFRLFPAGKKNDGLRALIKQLMELPEVDEIIAATDAGREGELIFRHIYNACGCTKPVKRLWTTSLTDEAINKCLKNLPSDSNYDGEYEAAFVREKSDWLIGMNLSRLYGSMDDYPHKIGRVKTPVLSIIVDRDNEIAAFDRKVTYRLEMDNGAVSETEWATREEAEAAAIKSKGKLANVLTADTEEKKQNRPLLHSLTTLQQEANRVFGYTAKQTLETAQSLYEKRLITYPRTSCNYISDDMQSQIVRVIDIIGGRPDYAERVINLKAEGLNLDGRIINGGAMESHDHHAIIPEANSAGLGSLNDKEKNIYELIVNRLLCAVDKEYRYIETNYEFWCEDITYTLKSVKPLETGWKAFSTDSAEVSAYVEHAEGSSFRPQDITVKECVARPKNHFNDDTLLSVMNNIDNRIDDKELKAAVSGKGIGTEATRAEIIEQLIEGEYIERKGKYIVSTDFGRAFIASVPESVKSVERTAQWEQTFDGIKNGKESAEDFIKEVCEYIKSVIIYEKSPERYRTPVHHKSSRFPERKVIGKCPRCGQNIYEGKNCYYCESGESCGFTLWKQDKFVKETITPELAAKLINKETVSLTAISKDGEEYAADFIIEDTGEYINLKRLKAEKVSLGVCPRCGKNIYEGKNCYYCESGKDGCKFMIWKEDRYNGISITPANVTDFLKGRNVYKRKKKIGGGAENVKYTMTDTGEYVNIRAEKE